MELTELIGFFLAIFAGIKLLDWSISFLEKYITGWGQVLPIAVFAIIFVGVLILLTYLGKSLKTVLDMTLLGSLDDLAGALMGIVKWAFFISIIIWIYESYAGEFENETIRTSYLYGPVSGLAPGLIGFFSGLYPSFMEIFDHSMEQINSSAFST